MDITFEEAYAASRVIVQRLQGELADAQLEAQVCAIRLDQATARIAELEAQAEKVDANPSADDMTSPSSFEAAVAAEKRIEAREKRNARKN